MASKKKALALGLGIVGAVLVIALIFRSVGWKLAADLLVIVLILAGVAAATLFTIEVIRRLRVLESKMTTKPATFTREREILQADFTEALLSMLPRHRDQSILILASTEEARASRRLASISPALRITVVDVTEAENLAEIGSFQAILVWIPSGTDIRATVNFETMQPTADFRIGPSGEAWGSQVAQLNTENGLEFFVGDDDGALTPVLTVRAKS